ncbi:hypothetical protein TRICI_002180 [Trichomonascus ciferrii]|uniref:Pre-mRNA-processing factor 19 n=1 Tax=Trichomonascus ciferrii TaxID=44093 RepID=A0A642V6H4_9ASCO|nr:hypothetical protein TRICI_002180 [Trichomonascus ciferrii]
MALRHLIECHPNGADPVNGQELSADEVIEIQGQASHAVRPKPPVYTSIPSLLSSLQTEWDAMALETFSLKQQLLKTRQELSSALYHHDAAVRVVARLTKERDEARDALSKLSASLGTNNTAAPTTTSHAEPMEVEQPVSTSGSIPDELVRRIQDAQKELSSTRKGRKIPETWASKEEVSSLAETVKTKQLFTSVTSMAVKGSLILSGGGKSQAGVYSIDDQQLVGTAHASGIVTSSIWVNDSKFAVGTKNGSIDVFEYPSFDKLGSISNVHSGALTDLAVLPAGEDLLVSLGKDNIWAIHDINNFTTLFQTQAQTQSSTTRAALHPDGQYFAIGASTGEILILDLTTGSTVETLASNSGSISALVFSEDGRSLASAGTDSPSQAEIWNLARPNDDPRLLQYEALGDGTITGLSFDYSGKFLAACTPAGVEVGWYDKKAKSWIPNVFHATAAAVSLSWGQEARTLATISAKGNIHVFQC